MWVFVHSTSVGSLFSVTLLPGPPGPQADVASDAGNDVVCDPPHPVSPLLAFLTEYPDLFKEEILGRLDPGRAGYFLLHEYFTICISILQ